LSDATPWERGRIDGRHGPPQLLFGRMNEDWRVEAAIFPPGGRIFCIASAGCVALALAARGFRVTAVDINPAQIEYAQARAAGAPPRLGVIDRRLGWAHRAMPWLGLSGGDLRRFLELSAVDEQTAVWRNKLDTRRLRAFLRCGFSRALLRLSTGRSLLESLPPRFDRVVLQRLERTWAHHPNRENPFVWRFLLGCDSPAGMPDAGDGPATPEIDFVCADAVRFLDEGPPHRFDGFTLSNIVEAVPAVYRERLLAAVRRAAAPGAFLIVRSLIESGDGAAEWAARDRSPLWGAVEVTEAASGAPVRSGSFAS
jgi:S-adenosylmethionine:diacylglycerol 3-amino-3-carboxypropyl transferase